MSSKCSDVPGGKWNNQAFTSIDELMVKANAKYDTLKKTGKWGKSSDKVEQSLSLTANIETLQKEVHSGKTSIHLHQLRVKESMAGNTIAAYPPLPPVFAKGRCTSGALDLGTRREQCGSIAMCQLHALRITRARKAKESLQILREAQQIGPICLDHHAQSNKPGFDKFQAQEKIQALLTVIES